MRQQWSRIGVRALSVGLLVTGVIGGVHLGQIHGDEQQSTDVSLTTFEADVQETRLLKMRQNAHAAGRAQQRAAEGDAAAAKAATEARSASTRARALEKRMIARKAAAKARSGALVPYAGEIPTSCGEFVGNRAIGCALTLAAGFGIDQFPCLNELWNKESGWNARAANKGSGAYAPGHTSRVLVRTERVPASAPPSTPGTRRRWTADSGGHTTRPNGLS